MRMPRVRFTMRTLLILVAVAAFSIGGMRALRRQIRRLIASLFSEERISPLRLPSHHERRRLYYQNGHIILRHANFPVSQKLSRGPHSLIRELSTFTWLPFFSLSVISLESGRNTPPASRPTPAAKTTSGTKAKIAVAAPRT